MKSRFLPFLFLAACASSPETQTADRNIASGDQIWKGYSFVCKVGKQPRNGLALSDREDMWVRFVRIDVLSGASFNHEASFYVTPDDNPYGDGARLVDSEIKVHLQNEHHIDGSGESSRSFAKNSTVFNIKNIHGEWKGTFQYYGQEFSGTCRPPELTPKR